MGIHLSHGGTAVTCKIGSAFAVHGLVVSLSFASKSDCLYCSCSGLCNGFRNILWSLAHAGQEDTRCWGFYRTQLCMGFSQEIVGINACCQHGCNLYVHPDSAQWQLARTTISASITNLFVVQQVRGLYHQQLPSGCGLPCLPDP